MSIFYDVTFLCHSSDQECIKNTSFNKIKLVLILSRFIVHWYYIDYLILYIPYITGLIKKNPRSPKIHQTVCCIGSQNIQPIKAYLKTRYLVSSIIIRSLVRLNKSLHSLWACVEFLRKVNPYKWTTVFIFIKSHLRKHPFVFYWRDVTNYMFSPVTCLIFHIALLRPRLHCASHLVDRRVIIIILS